MTLLVYDYELCVSDVKRHCNDILDMSLCDQCFWLGKLESLASYAVNLTPDEK